MSDDAIDLIGQGRVLLEVAKRYNAAFEPRMAGYRASIISESTEAMQRIADLASGPDKQAILLSQAAAALLARMRAGEPISFPDRWPQGHACV